MAYFSSHPLSFEGQDNYVIFRAEDIHSHQRRMSLASRPALITARLCRVYTLEVSDQLPLLDTLKPI